MYKLYYPEIGELVFFKSHLEFETIKDAEKYLSIDMRMVRIPTYGQKNMSAYMDKRTGIIIVVRVREVGRV